MKSKLAMRIGTLAAAVCVAFTSMPVFAADGKQTEISFENITATDATTLSGEAKVLVRVRGAEGNLTMAQTALDFDGDLKYKSIKYLKGSDNPENGETLIPVNSIEANKNNKVTAGILSVKNGIEFGADEELFVLTFSGDPGKDVTLKLSDTQNSYFTVGGEELHPSANDGITITASDKTNTGKKAVVKLTMDKVTSFSGADKTGITLKITSEKTDGYSVYSVLDNALVSKGGHRESTSVPSFTVENTVLADDTYTVELSGIGYITYKVTGVTFDEPLSITNAEFVPGDVNSDNKVDADDKAAVAELIANSEYSEAADFNRDNKVNEDDLAVFEGIADEKPVPAKMPKPTVAGGNKKITVKWIKPSDESVTGYTLKYGTTSLNNTKEIAGIDTTSIEITNLSAATQYRVQIAAKNANGTGEFSDIATASTYEAYVGGGQGGGGTGGGGGGSSSGGGGGGGFTPSAPDNTNNTENTETFTDLGNHEWAKDAIYSLKDKGIISGVSDTEFAPANNIKRGDFILILTRMLSVNNEFTENFADVPESAYYYQAIGSAKAAGIAQGSGENFMPENSITRQDLITLAYRAFLAKGYITETDDFTSLDAFADKGDISDYAQTAMASMVKAGIIQGSNGNVNPKGSATRAEVAVMCARLVELMK